VLKLRFGLDDDRPQTLQEIGTKLNLTRERIRQIEQKAKRRLARSHNLQQLRGYLN
jgi:RNA polymerase primary sigma factor